MADARDEVGARLDAGDAVLAEFAHAAFDGAHFRAATGVEERTGRTRGFPHTFRTIDPPFFDFPRYCAFGSSKLFGDLCDRPSKPEFTLNYVAVIVIYLFSHDVFPIEVTAFHVGTREHSRERHPHGDAV